MSVEMVKEDEYLVEYNSGTQNVRFDGTIRLRTTDEYAPITALLHKAHDSVSPSETVCLDFSQLRFLNSSGINAISRFVIAARKQSKINLKVIGNQEIYWQQKSLKNLKRLWNDVEIAII